MTSSILPRRPHELIVECQRSGGKRSVCRITHIVPCNHRKRLCTSRYGTHAFMQAIAHPSPRNSFVRTTATGHPRGRARRTHLITWLLPLKLNSPSLTENPHPNKQLITSHPPFAFDSNLVVSTNGCKFHHLTPLSLPPPGEPESELRGRRREMHR